MAKVKITAQFSDSEADYRHVDINNPDKPIIVTVRAQVADQWVKNGWAIIVPESTETEELAEPEKAPAKNPGLETADMKGAPETAEGVGNRRAASKRKPK